MQIWVLHICIILRVIDFSIKMRIPFLLVSIQIIQSPGLIKDLYKVC